jgi:hypothetical protein
MGIGKDLAKEIRRVGAMTEEAFNAETERAVTIAVATIKDDIAKNGLQEPITLLDGKILTVPCLPRGLR